MTGDVEAAVQASERRDRLTGLPNGLWLDEWFAARCDDAAPFFAAFVELDRFRRLNAVYGYADADRVLRAVAAFLATVPRARSVRAHGDEFYLVGTGPPPPWTPVVAGIAELRVASADGRRMRCSASLGWCRDTDLARRTPTALRRRLERACKQAKWAPDRVVHGVGLPDDDPAVLYGSCPACGARYEVSLPPGVVPGRLGCPVC